MIRQEQCDKVCRILDDVLANRPTERDSLIVAVRKAFDALKKQRWIPCSEKLPDTYLHDEIGIMGERVGEFRLSKPVLGYTLLPGEEGNMQVVWYEDDLDGRTGWQTVPDCMDVNVIAWMPLPKPYRRDADAEE